MKLTKYDISNIAHKEYDKLISMFGLMDSMRIVKEIHRLLKKEKQRRRNE